MQFRQPSAEEKVDGLERDSEVGVFLLEVKAAQDIRPEPLQLLRNQWFEENA